MSLPSISIVMPSFNQSTFIGESVESVLSQNYPNLELIVVDGGSTDDTLNVLKKFGSKVTVISEKDRGQADALNKGIRLAKNDVIGWLNSDDLYRSGSLQKVGELFAENPKTSWVLGHSNIIDEKGQEIREWISAYKALRLRRYSYESLLSENYISQMGVFIKRSLLLEVGGININYHYAMDYDLWLRLAKRAEPGLIDSTLASFRMYDTTKSITNFGSQFKEDFEVAKQNSDGLVWPIVLHFLNNIKIVTIYQLMALYRQVARKR